LSVFEDWHILAFASTIYVMSSFISSSSKSLYIRGLLVFLASMMFYYFLFLKKTGEEV
jgi:hypothetical protein